MIGETELHELIIATLNRLDLNLLELNIGRPHGDVHISIVVHKRSGVSLDDLSEAQKILRPRLALEYGRDKLSLEIASPGTSRKLKSVKEYEFFRGSDVEVLITDTWQKAKIINSDKDNVELEIASEKLKIPYSDIRKARLC